MSGAERSGQNRDIDPGETCRLHKWLAACGVASRRSAEQLILAGRVALNGQQVRRLGTLCRPLCDIVEVDGRPVRPPQSNVYLAVNKPRGYVSTVRDPHAPKRVVDLAPAGLSGRVKPVGRLDKESEGLLLLTNDGPLIHRLTHPAHHVEKEYHVGITGADFEQIVRSLKVGVTLDDGPATALEASVFRREAGSAVLRVVLSEGRKRQIRRMIERLGGRVTFLRRVRIGPILLGRLPTGRCRCLTKHEIRLLYELTGLGTGKRHMPGQPARIAQ